jgi:hypothetical protein
LSLKAPTIHRKSLIATPRQISTKSVLTYQLLLRLYKFIFSGAKTGGGVVSYTSDTLYEEVAFIASHFHWSQNDILNLEYKTRQHWVVEINKINEKLI